MINVIATITLKSAAVREEFLKHFNANVENVLAEDGCIYYQPTIDIDSGISKQGPLRNEVVVVVEKWESIKALHDHLGAPHMAEYKLKVKDLVAGTELQVLGDA